jgi:hypothetical protein
MADDANIKVKITTDTTQAQQGLDQTANKAESFGSRFKSTFAGVLAAGVIQNVAGKVFDFGKSSVEAYEAAQQTQLKFVDAMGRIPGASAATTKALMDQAKALSQVTVYSAGQSKAALATLASYGLTGDQLKTLLPLVQDYATKTGQDLPTAAGSVGKALLGQGRALKGVGIDFTNTKTLAGNFQEIVTGLQSKVGGLSVEMGETSAGKMKIYQNQVTAMKVQLGAGLVPAIEAVMPVLKPLMDFIANNAKWFVPMALGIIAVAGAFIFLNFAVGLFMANPPVLLLLAIAAAIVAIVVVVILLVKNWSTVWSVIKIGAMDVWRIMLVVWGAIYGAVYAVWGFIVAYWPLLLGILFGPIGLAAGLIIKYWSDIWNAAVAVWSWFATAWNALYGWITAPFFAAWSWIVAVWSGIPGFFAGIVGAIGGFFSRVTGAIVAPFAAAWSAVVAGASAVGSWFAGIPGAIGGALSGVFNAIIGPFQAAWNWINSNVLSPLKSAWNAVANSINAFKIHIPGVSILGHQIIPDIDWSPPIHVPTLAQGGLLTASGLVYAHAGEVISPAPAGLAKRDGPAVVITHAHFSERVDVATFGRRLAWTLQTQGV